MAIISNKDDDLKYKKQQIELYFSIHPEETERAEYLKSAYQDRYTEIVVDGVRVGYKPQENGLLMWEGAYLSRTSESVFSWSVVAEWTAQLIDKRNTSSTPKLRRRRTITASSYHCLTLRTSMPRHRKKADSSHLYSVRSFHSRLLTKHCASVPMSRKVG